MTAAQKAKEIGLKSLSLVAELTKQSTQTLNNWHNDKPELFEIVLFGCLEKVKNMLCKKVKVNFTIKKKGFENSSDYIILKFYNEVCDYIDIHNALLNSINNKVIAEYKYGTLTVDAVKCIDFTTDVSQIKKVWEFGKQPKIITISEEVSMCTSQSKIFLLISKHPDRKAVTRFRTSARAVEQLKASNNNGLIVADIDNKLTVITLEEMEWNDLADVMLKHVGSTYKDNGHWEKV